MVFGSVLVQNYGLLVCSLIFVFLRKLSQLDIVFAIAAVHSPIFHMLLLESIGFLTSRQYVSRFHHFGSLRLPCQLLIIGVIPLWIVLSGINVLDFPIVECIHQEDRPLAIPQLSIVEWLVRLIFEPFSAYVAQFLLFLNQKLTLLDSVVAIYLSGIIISMIYGFLMTFPFLIWIVSKDRPHLLQRALPNLYALRIIFPAFFILMWGFNLRVYYIEAGFDFQYGQARISGCLDH
jgi:hypothetical protein